MQFLDGTAVTLPTNADPSATDELFAGVVGSYTISEIPTV